MAGCVRPRRRTGRRVRLAGPLTGPALDAAYAAADLLVSPSRGETYGMVVDRGAGPRDPGAGDRVGGLPIALGRAPDGTVPGLLVAPAEPAALAGARAGSPTRACASRLRRAARARRDTLTGWDVTARIVSRRASRPRRDRVRRLAAAARAGRRCRPLDRAGRPAGPAPRRCGVHDLGSGTGSMARWLAPRLPGPQHWVLHDRDAGLLARAAGTLPRRRCTAEGPGSATSPG